MDTEILIQYLLLTSQKPKTSPNFLRRVTVIHKGSFLRLTNAKKRRQALNGSKTIPERSRFNLNNKFKHLATKSSCGDGGSRTLVLISLLQRTQTNFYYKNTIYYENNFKKKLFFLQNIKTYFVNLFFLMGYVVRFPPLRFRIHSDKVR
ncbi:hypothetical protein COY27_07115 [Candidatus Woesearchaeota archaeon CG_4_10_14_0_2_um_filter_33_13]|nr:MAG: hypothetical protein COY27_07115 [Candidatus Woesearchaeota archaeon CG_4_10_14_0_2_um_filter_33_13]